MLPQISLDDENYLEILEQAKHKIALQCPEWTDYNEHDPGITFLELFSWLKEAQQYYLDHMDKSMQYYFLQLFGASRRSRQPAVGFIRLDSPNTVKLLCGTPFYAENICLTLTENAWVSNARIQSMTSSDNNVYQMYLAQSGDMQWYPFGKNPEAGSAWIITFSDTLEEVRRLTIYLEFYETYPVRRNPIKEDYPKLAEYTAEAEIDGKWIPIETLSDETASFVVSGRICLELPENINVARIRFKLKNAWYDVPPLLTGIKMNVFKVCQKEQVSYYLNLEIDKENPKLALLPYTYATINWNVQFLYCDGDGYLSMTPEKIMIGKENINVVLPEKVIGREVMAVITVKPESRLIHPGKGDGFPYQEFDLQCKDLYSDSFAMLIRDNYDEKWYLWKQTDDLLKASHLDRVYRLDEVSGKLYFGDGIHGRMPDGELWIVSAAYTWAENGNLKGGRLDASMICESVSGSYEALSGGAAPETAEECRNRKQKSKLLPGRAVTQQDYEKLIKAAPGLMINNCRVTAGAPKSNTVQIAVEPYTNAEKAEENPIYLEILRRFLEPARLVGTQLNISFPRYADIQIYVAVTVDSYSSGREMELREHISRLFKNEYCSFGKPILYSAVYSTIDRMPQVLHLHELVIKCHQDGVRINRSGDLILPENGLPYLKTLDLKCIAASR